jgi:hypothetical protein
MLQSAIYNAMVSDATVSAVFAAYGDGKALWQYDRAPGGYLPKDVALPAGLIYITSAAPRHTRLRWRELQHAAVALYTNRNFAANRAEAQKVADLLHRAGESGFGNALSLSGYAFFGVTARSPEVTTDPQGWPHWMVRVHAFVEKA